MMHKSLVIGFMLVLLTSCSKKEEALTPIEPDRTTSCALDGMILLDYPGPKAQIYYDSDEPEYFCDTMEMFSIYLRPEQQKHIRALFTQDMGKTSWEKPSDNWINAKTAYYVYGSKKLGSMGPTLASFSRIEDAEAFVKQYGGKVLRFDQVTLDLVALDGGAQHDDRM